MTSSCPAALQSGWGLPLPGCSACSVIDFSDWIHLKENEVFSLSILFFKNYFRLIITVQ